MTTAGCMRFAQLAPLVCLLISVIPARSAELPACPAAVQEQARQAVKSLEQRQAAEDQKLRSHPTGDYATMNGPVLREVEKRKQREALIETLQAKAAKQLRCLLQGID